VQLPYTIPYSSHTDGRKPGLRSLLEGGRGSGGGGAFTATINSTAFTTSSQMMRSVDASTNSNDSVELRSFSHPSRLGDSGDGKSGQQSFGLSSVPRSVDDYADDERERTQK